MDKQKKELILLTVGLAVVGLAAYFSFHPKAPAAAPENAAPSASKAAASAEPPQEPLKAEARHEEGQAQGAAEKDPSKQVAAVGPEEAQPQLKPGRDPFQAPDFASASSAAATSTRPRPGGAPGSAQALPRLPVIPPLPFIAAAIPGGVQPPPGFTAAPQEKLRVTGIIHGDPDVAILRKGERRFIVREGDPVGSQYIVTKISGRRVVLSAGEHDQVILYLSGR
jgi:hypothetical protein